MLFSVTKFILQMLRRRKKKLNFITLEHSRHQQVLIFLKSLYTIRKEP
uniref:Uncharacterized protein n=1 Tax=Rhizophora mucronata TaxID=61149 RepID=A0A2P2QRL8_RHIMU